MSFLKPLTSWCLVWQPSAAVDTEFCFESRSASSRLSPTYADAVDALRQNPISFFIHFAQVALVERETNVLSCARRHTYSREPAQSTNRSDRRFWKTQIKLNHFVAVPLAGVVHIRLYCKRIACFQLLCRELQIAELKLRIAESVAERIQEAGR